MNLIENKTATNEFQPDKNISSLQSQLYKLDQLVIENNRQYEIEEQRYLTASLRAKSRIHPLIQCQS